MKAALQRSIDRLATHFAAAITYFSFLSLIPVLMVSFSVAGFVLAAHPDLLDSLKDEVIAFVPDNFSGSIGTVIDQAVNQRLAVGIFGLATALYSGLNWMNHVRQAVRAQWRPQWRRSEKAKGNFFMRYVWDLISLAGLAIAVVVTFSLTAIGTAAQDLVVGWLGIGDVPLLRSLLHFGPFVIAILADVLIFAWVYTILPFKDYRADKRTLVIGSLAMAVCFEILKAALTILVSRMSSSPTGAAFGAAASLIGLLLFFNLVARVFLMVAAWIATGAERADAAGGVDRSDDAGLIDGAGLIDDEALVDHGAARSERLATPAPVTVVLQGHETAPRYRRAVFGAGAVSGWALARILGRRRSR